MKNNLSVTRLQNAFLQGNTPQIEFLIGQAIKQAANPLIRPQEKAAIALEAARGWHLLGDLYKAGMLAETIRANIPAGHSDMVGDVKRLQVRIFLDSLEYSQAENLISETDGMEVTIAGKGVVLNRRDEEVTIETWLLSMETALAQGKREDARVFFEKAVDALGREEAALRKKQMTVKDRRMLMVRLEDMRRMTTLLGAVLQIQHGDSDALEIVEDLKSVFEINPASLPASVTEAAAPGQSNAPMLSRCRVILGLWSDTGVENQSAPPGLNLMEAQRWQSFAEPFTVKAMVPVGAAAQSPEDQENVSHETALATTRASAGRGGALEHRGETHPGFGEQQQMVPVLYHPVDHHALESIAQTLRSLENLASKAAEGAFPGRLMYKQNYAFGGNLISMDMNAIITNVTRMKFTGFIKYVWDPQRYASQIATGKIDGDLAEKGLGYMFAVDGQIIDTTVGTNHPSTNAEESDRNFDFMLQIGFSIGLDDNTPPDITAEGIAQPEVRERKVLTQIVVDHLIHKLTDISNRVYGLVEEEEELNWDNFGK